MNINSTKGHRNSKKNNKNKKKDNKNKIELNKDKTDKNINNAPIQNSENSKKIKNKKMKMIINYWRQ